MRRSASAFYWIFCAAALWTGIFGLFCQMSQEAKVGFKVISTNALAKRVQALCIRILKWLQCIQAFIRHNICATFLLRLFGEKCFYLSYVCNIVTYDIYRVLYSMYILDLNNVCSVEQGCLEQRLSTAES